QAGRDIGSQSADFGADRFGQRFLLNKKRYFEGTKEDCLMRDAAQALCWPAKKVRHRKPAAHARARYRCFLPDLAGLAGMRRAGPMPDPLHSNKSAAPTLRHGDSNVGEAPML